VSALVAPLREESGHGRDIPRPYIILPPLAGPKSYAPGEKLSFGLVLFGSIIQLLPYIMLSLSKLEENGLGRKVQANNGKRGHFKITSIEAYHPFQNERQLVYRAGKAIVNSNTLAITIKDVQERAATLSKEQITLNFLTPTRINDQERAIGRAEFRPILHRLLDRLSAIQAIYGSDDAPPLYDTYGLVERAETIHCSDDATTWRKLNGYSRRTQSATVLGGLVGRATFVGDLAPYLEPLVWGELIHIGKNCVKGNGWYMIEGEGVKNANLQACFENRDER
jgi:hypothetical protein